MKIIMLIENKFDRHGGGRNNVYLTKKMQGVETTDITRAKRNVTQGDLDRILSYYPTAKIIIFPA